MTLMDAFHGSRVTRDRGSREIISAVPIFSRRARLLVPGNKKERSLPQDATHNVGKALFLIVPRARSLRAIHINPPQRTRKRFSVFAMLIHVGRDTTQCATLTLCAPFVSRQFARLEFIS